MSTGEILQYPGRYLSIYQKQIHRGFGHGLLCFPDIQLALPMSKWRNSAAEHPVLCLPTNTQYKTDLSLLREAMVIIALTATITTLILCAPHNLWQSLLSLGLSNPLNYLQLILTQPPRRRQKQLPGGQIWPFDCLGTESSDT